MGWAYTRSEVARSRQSEGFSKVNSCLDVSLDTRESAEKGVKWKMMAPVTKMGTRVEEKLNLGVPAGFRRQVCKRSGAISVAPTAGSITTKIRHTPNSRHGHSPVELVVFELNPVH